MKHTEEHQLGIKFDSAKPDYSLVPPHALEELVKVLTYGKNKYAKDNWRYLDEAYSRYFAAAQRHMWAMHRGESHDPESGYHHAAHAAACMFFMYELYMQDSLPSIISTSDVK